MGFFRNKTPNGKISTGTVHEIGARESQQDSFSVCGSDCAENGIFAMVADGMGGLVNSGELSHAVVSAVNDAYAPGALTSEKEQLLVLLKRAIDKAAELTAQQNYQSGTTFVACILRHGKLSWVSVGDSRLYLWRNGGLIQMNRDHDFAHDLQTMTLSGQITWQEAENNPRRESLTSYIGRNFPRYVDFNAEPVTLLKGDRVILMSDGIYRALSQREISRCLGKRAARCAAGMKRLIRKKNLAQQDNYTAVILEVK